MLDVSLVVIGFVIVAMSYFISEKIEQGKETSENGAASGQIHEIWSQKDEEKVRKQVEAVTAEKIEETVNHVDDELSTISNEKIMAVDEFSNQILEKIEKNHKDVVFLYNMLNEKQEEIKKMITEADTVRAELEDSIWVNRETAPKNYTAVDMLQRIAKGEKVETYQKLAEEEKEALSVMFKESKQKPQTTKESAVTERIEKKSKEDEPIIENPMDNRTENSEEQKEILESENSNMENLLDENRKAIGSDIEISTTTETDAKHTEIKLEETEEEMPSVKEQILELHEEGKSILEISKLLHTGQGEVKLIIDLFQGAEK